MGEEDYMEHIAKIVMTAKERGVFARSSHYVSILEGDVHNVLMYWRRFSNMERKIYLTIFYK